jgi:hypothetical protein
MRFRVNHPTGQGIVLEKHTIPGFRIAQRFAGAFAILAFSFLLCRVMHQYSSTMTEGPGRRANTSMTGGRGFAGRVVKGCARAKRGRRPTHSRRNGCLSEETSLNHTTGGAELVASRPSRLAGGDLSRRGLTGSASVIASGRPGSGSRSDLIPARAHECADTD